MDILRLLIVGIITLAGVSSVICIDDYCIDKETTAGEWFKLANTYFEQEKYVEAAEVCEEAARADPKVAPFALGIEGVMLYLEGNEEEVSKVHDRLRKINPDGSDGWILKGIGLGILEDAISMKAGSEGKNHDQLIEELSSANQDAIECFNRAIELDPNDAVAWAAKGSQLYSKLKRIQDEEEDEHTFYLGEGNWREVPKVDFTEATECFSRAIELDPELSIKIQNTISGGEIRTIDEGLITYFSCPEDTRDGAAGQDKDGIDSKLNDPSGKPEGNTPSPADNLDLMNCLCRCAKPVGSEFDCSYDLTPKPMVLGGSPSCGNLDNGPCMCQALGCFRAPLPTEGECYDACRNKFPGVPVTEEPKQGLDKGSSEPESEENLPPGSNVPAGSMVFKPETEPNDQIGDANEIKFASPVGVSGRITPANDVDYFRFNVESAGMLEVKMEQIPEEMKTRIDFYGKNFNWITRKDASNPGDQVSLLVDVPGAGQGFIAISDLDRRAHPSDYSFVADFLPAKDDGEPNNQAGDSTEIGFDQAVSAHICPVGDVDFYKYYVDSAGIMDVKFDQVPGDMKTRIDLNNKNMDRVIRKDASNAGDVLDWEVDLQGPATYYIAISDLDGKARSEPYSFTATFRSAPDSNEPNDVVGDSTIWY